MNKRMSKPEKRSTNVTILITIANAEYIPKKSYKNDAAFDLHTSETKIIPAQGFAMVHTNLKMAIPKGYYGQIFPRSGFALRGIQCHPGIIDSGYRGEVAPILYNHTTRPVKFQKGERIAQIVFKKVEPIEFKITTILSISERGSKGFGSTNKKKEVKYKIKATVRPYKEGRGDKPDTPKPEQSFDIDKPTIMGHLGYPEEGGF